MARVFRQRRQSASFSEINVTNLIDLGFTLMIIFMITTPLVEQSIQVELPVESQKEQEQKEPPKTEVVGIDARGQIYWSDRAVTRDQLQKLLDDAAAKPNQPIIALRADRTLDYQTVVTVLDQIEKSGLVKLNIDTQVGGSSDDSSKSKRKR
jgi:biopolymer transport protein ExbD